MISAMNYQDALFMNICIHERVFAKPRENVTDNFDYYRAFCYNELDEDESKYTG